MAGPGSQRPVVLAAGQLHRSVAVGGSFGGAGRSGDRFDDRLRREQRGQIDRLHEHVQVRVVGVADAVGEIAQRGDVPRSLGSRCQILDRGSPPLLRNACLQREPGAVGRDAEPTDTVLHERDLHGLAARKRQCEHLHGILCLPQEQHVRVIGRQGRGRVVKPTGEPRAATARQLDAPQLPDAAVARDRRMRGRDHREAAICGDGRLRELDQLFDIAGAHQTAKPETSPIRRVLSAGTGSTAARATSAANSATL